jgi:GNAT superfamily N-acetyltransferase
MLAMTDVIVPGVSFGLLDGRQAAAREQDLLALAQAASRPASGASPASRASRASPADGRQASAADLELARQLHVWRRQPGFALAEARHGGYLVGYAMGMPLRPSTSWWRDVTSPLPESLTAEHPGRTFAVTCFVVRAAWRRQGIGAQLHHLLLSGRPEERATLTATPQATAAQRALRTWGWTKVARTRTAAGEVEDMYLLSPLNNAPG